MPTTPDDVVLAPDEALAEAQRLLDAGRPFHAHEVLEAAWKRAPADERGLWQALAQLAVGLTHAARGNLAGAQSLLARASDGLAPFADDPPHSIDVEGLRAWAEAAGAGRSDDLPPLLRVFP